MARGPLLLSGLSQDEQRELLAAAHPRQLQPRDVLGHHGEPADILPSFRSGT